jgi:hypothetical protein
VFVDDLRREEGEEGGRGRRERKEERKEGGEGNRDIYTPPRALLYFRTSFWVAFLFLFFSV